MSLFYTWIIWRHLEGAITISREPGIAKLDLLGFYFFSFPQGSIENLTANQSSRDQARQTVPVPGPLSTALKAGAELFTSQTHYAVFQHLIQVVIPTGSLLTVWL